MISNIYIYLQMDITNLTLNVKCILLSYKIAYFMKIRSRISIIFFLKRSIYLLINTLELLTNIIINLQMTENKLNQHFVPIKKSAQDSEKIDSQKKLQLKQSDSVDIHRPPIHMQNYYSQNQQTKVKLPSLKLKTYQIERSQTILIANFTKKIGNQQDNVTVKFQSESEVILGVQLTKPEQQVQKLQNIEYILKKQPLRKRFGKLIPDYLSFPIGSNNKKLIQKLTYLDRAIQFYIENSKTCFFNDLKKTMLQSMQQIISLDDLLRILFLDPMCYQISWGKNQRIQDYDLFVKIASDEIEEQRKINLRKKLFQYLKKCHQQFLIMKNLNFQQINCWHPQFNLETIKIPTCELPPHPSVHIVQFIQQGQEQINLNPVNETINIISYQIQNQNSNNFQRSNIHSMMSTKVNHDVFINQLHSLVLTKEKQLTQEKMIRVGQCQFTNDEMKQLIEQIMRVYDMRGFSNIFLVNVVQSIHERFNEEYSKIQIEYCIDKLANSEVKFLTKVKYSNKGIILKINKENYHQILKLYNSD